MDTGSRINHKIWAIAWPAILSNISLPLLGLVDAAILGHLGTPRYLGAVAVGGAVLSFVYWGFSFLRMGTTGLVAKAMGGGREEGALLVLGQSVVLAVGISLPVILLHPLWLSAGLTLMAPQPDIDSLAGSYIAIRVYSAPAVLATYAITGWFIGRQNTRWPMLIALLTNLANIALDFLFILGLGMNSDGAALATLIAEYLGFALALAAVAYTTRQQRRAWLLRSLGEWRAYRRLLRSNRHLFVRTTCLLFSFAFFTAMGDNLGDEVLAANSLMIQLLMLAAYGLDGFAYAAEALSGNRIGARDLDGFHRAVAACATWSAGAALLASAMFLLLGSPLYRLLTDLPEVRALLQAYHWWLVALPLVAAPSYLLDGIFIGTASTRPMMYTMLASTLLIYLPSWYLTRAWGNHGLWFAFTVFHIGRGVSLYLCYRVLDRRRAWLPAGSAAGDPAAGDTTPGAPPVSTA
jgi:MATE family multidrug resistance protein